MKSLLALTVAVFVIAVMPQSYALPPANKVYVKCINDFYRCNNRCINLPSDQIVSCNNACEKTHYNCKLSLKPKVAPGVRPGRVIHSGSPLRAPRK